MSEKGDTHNTDVTQQKHCSLGFEIISLNSYTIF